ncbi:MAG: S41 family peptidase [Phycisphaerales bacterium]|jgi:carboxyl-terminal processing protease|nr:S41 family peptidase [Phycisphaerales bacterium]
MDMQLEAGRAARGRMVVSCRVAWVLGLVGLASGLSLGQNVDPASVARDVWQAAAAGDTLDLHATLEQIRNEDEGALAESIRLYDTNVGKTTEKRSSETSELRTSIDGVLAGEITDVKLSQALRDAITLYLLIERDNRPALLDEQRIRDLVAAGERAARTAEARGDWLMASELFFRLHTLFEEPGPSPYQKDIDRATLRLSMINLYTPHRMWELRNARRLLESEEPLPAYNAVKNDFHEKVAAISTDMLKQAISMCATRHIDPKKRDLREILIAGIDAVEAMVRTHDLGEAFPGLGNEQAVAGMIDALAKERLRLRAEDKVSGTGAIYATIERVLAANRKSVRVMDEALLHEFGNGVMGHLDRFSAIIWPDELARFQKNTAGRFIGIGVHIRLDEMFNLQIVTPLDGTPAQRAGLRANDIIKKVDGQSTVGFSLDQAIDTITGPRGTDVTLTIERERDGEKQVFDVDVKRDQIEVASVKGWERTGPGENDWDWFVDQENGIGYVRLTQFAEETSREFDNAVAQMRKQGLRGLVVDLRYNPGGLLDQAVELSNRFVDSGLLVRTVGSSGNTVEQHVASPGRATVNDLPIAVLINESSASASEILSGVIQDYAETGALRAVLVGKRTYGKGSVQNVWPLTGNASAIRLTTQYYLLPSGRMIHRLEGASQWGVDPDVEVSMLPSQEEDALNLRLYSDVWALDEKGQKVEIAEEQRDPDTLISEGVDVQLQTALVILQTQVSPIRLGSRTTSGGELTSN